MLDHPNPRPRRALQVAANLHLCGEVLDVFGRVGGFNFLWAWTTGRAAGRGEGPGDGGRWETDLATQRALSRKGGT